MELLDFYVSANGTKYTPDSIGDEYVYLRGNRVNHISHIICKVVDGQIDVETPHLSFINGADADYYIFKKDGKRPEKFFSSEVRRRLAEGKR